MVETSIDTGLTFSVLGPLAAEREGRPIELGAPKQRAVLALLLANPNRPMRAGRLITSIWGADASESYRRSLQTYVSNLRAVLDTEIPREGDSYALLVGPSSIDAVRFEEGLQEARESIATDPGHSASRLRELLAMWRGRPYSDVSDVEGIQAEINRLSELRLTAVELRIDAELAAGRHRELIAEVQALADEHPLRERFRAQHMVALYRSGRQAEALRVFERTREYLGEELGLEPSQELQDLELAILRHDQELISGTGLATTERLVFLATSVEGLNEAWDRNPQVMGESLWTIEKVLTESVEGNGGRVFQEGSDGLVAAFSELGAAVHAAGQAQTAIAGIDWKGLERLRVGIAIDVGEAESRGGGLSGPPVSRSQRLANLARGGQVLLSATVQEGLAASTVRGLQVRQLGEIKVVGFARPERIAQLVIEGIDSDFEGLRPTEDWVTPDGAAPFSLPGYEIRDLIGRGSIGAVYRAYQPSVGREVAIKVIRPTMSNHPRFFHRFETEARVIARLAHPHIVPLIDFWRDSDGAYLVLQYMSGGSLADALERGPIEVRQARRIIRQIAFAVDHSHKRGVAHGDISTTNILLGESGNAFLSDFDIASRVLEPEGGVSIPPEFPAPELPRTGPTPAGDVYAFGKVVDLLVDSPAIEDVVQRATNARPETRYATVMDLLRAVEHALGGDDEPSVAVASPRNPYKGLRPFEEADAADFHGRDSLVEELVDKIEQLRFVTVIGSSGSGKSSLVRAGLLPALARGAIEGSDGWPTLIMTPGEHPVERLVERLEALATTPVPIRDILKDHGLDGIANVLLEPLPGDLLLVIDQFEELFAQSHDIDVRQRFVELVAGAVSSAASRVRVVTSLRADFYKHLLDEPDLNQVSRIGQVTVLSPTRQELIEMIVRPAEAAGLQWEPGLPERIAGEVIEQPGGLPLLQYALTETVENRAGEILKTGDYEAVGGVDGAVVKRAEEVFSQLTTKHQQLARQVFLRLVQVDSVGDDTRRRIRRSELESLGLDRAEVDVMVDPFIAERLLLGDRDPVTRGPTVEVAHEALLREWPRLAGWIEAERDSLLLARRLRDARAEWERSGEDPDFLLTGARLIPFADWSKNASLTADERQYLARSESADLRRRSTLQRRRKALAAIVGIAATVALVLAGWALVERDRANDEAAAALVAEQQAEAAAARAESEADRAEQNALLARSRELATSAISVLDEDPRLSKLLAVAAAGIAEPGRETVLALHEAFVADRIRDVYQWTRSPEPVSLWTDLHPSGTWLVASGSGPGAETGGFAHGLEVVELTTDRVAWSMDTEAGLAAGPAFFSPGGDSVVVGVFAESDPISGGEAGIHVMDSATGTSINHIDLGGCGGIVIGVSRISALAVTVGDNSACFLGSDVDYRLEVVDIQSGRRDLILSSRLGALTVNNTGISAVMSEDGRYVAYGRLGSDQPDVVVIETETGEIVRTFETPETQRPKVFDLSLDGSLLAFGGFPVRVGDVTSGQVVAEVVRVSPGLPTAAFGLDGGHLYVTGPEMDLRIWDVEADEELLSVPAAGSGPISASSSGEVLVADPQSQSAVLVDQGLRGEVLTLPLPDCFIASGGLEAIEEALVSYQACPDHLLTTVTDPQTGEVMWSLEGAAGQSYGISPDGSRLVRQEGDFDGIIDSITVRGMATGASITQLDGLCAWDSKASSEPGYRQEGCVAFPEQPFPFWVWDVGWAPDGSVIVAVDTPTTHGGMAAWNATSGDLVGTHDFGPGRSGSDFVFSPDSREVIVSVLDRRGPTTLQRFDTRSWELIDSVEVESIGDESNMLGLVGWGADGRLIGVSGWRGQGASLVWFDAETLELTQRRDDIHEGSPRDGSIHESGRLIATASSDGGVRIWNAQTGDLLHEIRLGERSPVAVDFVDENHLLVGAADGTALVMTTDLDELVRLVSASLTRGFSPAECERFNFGDDCPTLGDMRSP